jgi:hypothetical protein
MAPAVFAGERYVFIELGNPRTGTETVRTNLRFIYWHTPDSFSMALRCGLDFSAHDIFT